MKLYRGGCSCRAVLFTVRRYLYVQACHCDACKKRTGSAYGLSVMVENDDVAAFSGQRRTYTQRRKRQGRCITNSVPNVERPYDGASTSSPIGRSLLEVLSNISARARRPSPAPSRCHANFTEICHSLGSIPGPRPLCRTSPPRREA